MNLPNEKFTQKNYNVLLDGDKLVAKMWNKHVKIEDQALNQIREAASMPFVKPYIAAMPDTHWGMGATVGSVIPTVGAIMPAAVGVDIGCGMMAVRTNIQMHEFRESIGWLKDFFEKISAAVPHGRTNDGGPGDRGAWGIVPPDIQEEWSDLVFTGHTVFQGVFKRHPGALSRNAEKHLGTLGTGNHFIEICTEIENSDSNLWVVIHSGSRGFGNRIGTYFTKLAGDLAKKWQINLPNKDLGYFPQGTQEYDDYIAALNLAQEFAWRNRTIMMGRALDAIGAKQGPMSEHYITSDGEPTGRFVTNPVPAIIHMHHNYADIKGDTILTRKGAVDASEGNWVIIPGSMGAKTYIARGLGNPEAFHSCSHGAGRAMSRGAALKAFTVKDHQKATEGVYCDKTAGTVDETPLAYKDIDQVMESQKDLVEPVVKIKQLVCVKGISD